jgi:hypothetical protein
VLFSREELMQTIVLVVPSVDTRVALGQALEARGYAVNSACSWAAVRQPIKEVDVRGVVFDLEQPDAAGDDGRSAVGDGISDRAVRSRSLAEWLKGRRGGRNEAVRPRWSSTVAEIRRRHPDVTVIALAAGRRVRVHGASVVRWSTPVEMGHAIVAKLAERARRAELDRLFDRWCAGGPGAHEARDSLVTILSEMTRVAVARGRDPDNRDLAIEDALTKFLESPDRYDCRKGTLENLLAKMARDASIDLWRQERRRVAHETTPTVDLSLTIATSLVVSPEERFIAVEEERLEHQRRMAVCWSTTDRAFIEALEAQDLERGLRALGIADVPEAERTAELRKVVKRLRERNRQGQGPRNRRPRGGGGTQ